VVSVGKKLRFRDNCAERLYEIWDGIAADPPDVIFVLGTYFSFNLNHEAIFDSKSALYKATRGKAEKAGVKFILLRVTPRFNKAPSDCLLDVNGDIEKCALKSNNGFRNDTAINEKTLRDDVARLHPNQTFIDMIDHICPWDTLSEGKDAEVDYTKRHCPPFIGGLPVYRDEHHISRYYAATLATGLEDKLKAAGENTGLRWID
jgi:hypothetical protein